MRTEFINSACPHLSLWSFNYKLKLFIPSRFAQWKLHFPKNKLAEEKAGGSGMEVEGRGTGHWSHVL